MKLPALPDTFADTRDTLQRVAIHVVARSRQQATGRIGLRVTPGGFGTPTFGDGIRRIRLSRELLVCETEVGTRAVPIDGASLSALARVADVDLAADLDVGHDTRPVGDVDEPLSIDARAVRALSAWYTVAAGALDAFAAARPRSSPSPIQLWPEHFDVALDAAFDPSGPAERRVNLGGSPGDGYHTEPYAYIGPWTDDRPGDDDGFWSAPFGAVLGYAELAAADDPVDAATAFFLRGFDRLAG